MGEHFDGEVTHATLTVEVLKLTLDHDVESLEQKRVKVTLDLLFRLILFECFKFFSSHTHKCSSMFTSKININTLSEVRDLSSYHIRGLIAHVVLATVFTTESSAIFHHFTTAVVRKTGRVENSIIVLDAANIAIQKEEMVLVSIIFTR